MPPTADNTILGFRKSVSLSTAGGGQSSALQASMKEISMMSGDTQHQQHNGFMPQATTIAPPRKNSKYDFFYKETCLYSHKVFLNAAKVFSTLKHESKEEQDNPYLNKRNGTSGVNGFKHTATVAIQDLEFEDDNEKRLTFQLAYETLKCKYSDDKETFYMELR